MVQIKIDRTEEAKRWIKDKLAEQELGLVDYPDLGITWTLDYPARIVRKEFITKRGQVKIPYDKDVLGTMHKKLDIFPYLGDKVPPGEGARTKLVVKLRDHGLKMFDRIKGICEAYEKEFGEEVTLIKVT